MPTRDTRGVSNLYPVIAIACVTAFGCAVWSSEPSAPRAAAAVGWLASFGAVVVYGIELRRDPVTAAMVALVVSLFIAIFGGGIFLAGAAPSDSPALSAALAAIPALLVIAGVVRMQWGPEAFPNPIRRQFGTRAGEERGVQVAVAAPSAIRTGELGTLEVYLQNTWDAPRDVAVTVGGKGLWRASYPAPFAVTLAPLAVMVLAMPFAIEETERPRIQLVTEVSVTGGRGRRRRLWRAPWRAGRPRRAYTAAGAGSAGGIASPMSVSGSRVEPPTLPSVSARTVWILPDGAASLVRK